MSFSATLYNCKDDPRKLSKTLPEEGKIIVNSITPTSSCDILNPTFILDYDSGYTTKNYIVVDSPFNRSYFITDMKIDIGKKIVISCAVDVLETYKDEIEKLSVNIMRTEKPEKIEAVINQIPDYKMIPDTNFNIRSGFQYYHETFKNASDKFESGSYILSWIGGAYDSSYILVAEEPQNWDTDWDTYYIYDANLDQWDELSDIYSPAPGFVPDFNIVSRTWNGVYIKING